MKTFPNSEIRLRFVGKRDKCDKDYYFAYSGIPASVDLSNTVLFFFPDEDPEEGRFGGELVIRVKEAGRADKDADVADKPR